MSAGAPVRTAAARFLVYLACITAAGLVLRLAYLALGGDTVVSGDGGYYHLGANFLADGRGFADPIALTFGIRLPGADHPPAWTTVLGVASWLGFRTITDHQVVASLVGTATIPVVGFAGRRLSDAERGAHRGGHRGGLPELLGVRERSPLGDPRHPRRRRRGPSCASVSRQAHAAPCRPAGSCLWCGHADPRGADTAARLVGRAPHAARRGRSGPSPTRSGWALRSARGYW